MTGSDRPGPEDPLDRYTAITVPVRFELEADQAVVTLRDATQILQDAESIALGPCVCRVEARRCEAPVDTCLAIDRAAIRAVDRQDGFRFVDIQEALATLRMSHAAGLVHLAYRQHGGAITEFCSCCSCCCWFLTKLRSLNAQDALRPSRYLVQRTLTACIGCETCVKRCPFGAWTTHETCDHKPDFHTDRCLGCGVCVSACPSGALRLVAREGGRVLSSSGDAQASTGSGSRPVISDRRS